MVVGKRIFDLLFALPGTLLLLPLFFVISLWIKFDTSGPVFFRQSRVGRFGKIFSIYKFRTMVVEVESTSSLITIGYDKRITQSGRFLRKYKLDELAQLFNVLKGEMSLVGPRPEVPRYVARYPDSIKEIVLSVKPGITDLASLVYKDENELLAKATDPENVYIYEVLPNKLSYYVRYVSERSLWLDFMLILKTLAAVFGRKALGL